jgi:beta-galactosidase
LVPIADNEVTFRVSGEGKLIGVGNGDPTSHESDKGTSRKAFSGFCMAVVQSTKTAANITVEATSPGLAPASVTIAAKGATLRPQVAVWEREVPMGPGITGLWRPIPRTGDVNGPLALPPGGGDTVFSLRQDGNSLTGSVEGAGGGFFGGNDAPLPIEEGKVDGNSVSFKAGNSTYAGTLKGDQIELQRRVDFDFRPTSAPAAPAGTRPAIGPPPDGSDPSIPEFRQRLAQALGPIVLHRVQR